MSYDKTAIPLANQLPGCALVPLQFRLSEPSFCRHPYTYPLRSDPTESSERRCNIVVLPRRSSSTSSGGIIAGRNKEKLESGIPGEREEKNKRVEKKRKARISNRETDDERMRVVIIRAPVSSVFPFSRKKLFFFHALWHATLSPLSLFLSPSSLSQSRKNISPREPFRECTRSREAWGGWVKKKKGKRYRRREDLEWREREEHETSVSFSRVWAGRLSRPSSRSRCRLITNSWNTERRLFSRARERERERGWKEDDERKV